jgi:carnitine O-acetyltransferase
MDKLPVPPLDQTLAKWRKTLEPLCTAEELQSFDAKLKADYPKLEELHNRLVQHREHQTPGNDNWLSKWWLAWAYHSWREPVFINSNWFTVFADHPNQPADILHPHTPVVPQGHVSAFQLHRCAGFVLNALQMHLAIQ